MANKDLRGKAHIFKKNKDVWWYETSKGIDFMVMIFGHKLFMVSIPWKTIRNALKRKDKKCRK